MSSLSLSVSRSRSLLGALSTSTSTCRHVAIRGRCMHSCAVLLAQFRRPNANGGGSGGSSGGGRTKLAASLKPEKGKGRLEVFKSQDTIRKRPGGAFGSGSGSGSGSADRKPFGSQERKPFSQDRKPFNSQERKPFNSQDRKPVGSYGQERKPPSSGQERQPVGFKDRDRRPFGQGDRDRPAIGFKDRKPSAAQDRKPFIPQLRTPVGFADRKPAAKEKEKEGEEVEERLEDEFFHPSTLVSSLSDAAVAGESGEGGRVGQESLPTHFESPPLLPGLVSSLKELLGDSVRPTPIQSLSIKWLIDNAKKKETSTDAKEEGSYKQYLLASETGSGKSIAYLLPVLQHLKETEKASRDTPHPLDAKFAYSPRALVLSPTHELSRQLSGFAKGLLHHSKLRVVCASRANTQSTDKLKRIVEKGKTPTSASQMKAAYDAQMDGGVGEMEVKEGTGVGSAQSGFPVDMLVGTPMKIMEMIRGRGWDRTEAKEDVDKEDAEEGESRKLRRGRDKMPHHATWKTSQELGLHNVEWVVVDEADVLFDPDFLETTESLLADISAARGVPQKASPSSSEEGAIEYPFNLILTSATIPNTLHTYLSTTHPNLLRLASPHLHHLPKSLKTEYAPWTGGNKYADIERRIRQVWAEDFALARSRGEEEPVLSKVLVFCNKSSKVEDLGEYLEEKGMGNVALTSGGEVRKRGSNRHLEGFLRRLGTRTTGAVEAQVDGEVTVPPSPPSPSPATKTTPSPASTKDTPKVLITTSLLSRGLDFSPDIRHVLIVDEPRNMVDFLHRAGRVGRAGFKGRVVIFGKMKGRGSERAKEVRKRVGVVSAYKNRM